MNSIFDIEEKSNNEVNEDYLISTGWELTYVGFYNLIYIKTIRHKNRPSRFIRFYYNLDTFPKRTLRNANTWEEIRAHDVMTLELQIKEWQSNWENNINSLYEPFNY